MRENADRFEGLAETYALHRPGYPAEVFGRLCAASPKSPRLAVDVGAGPGNSTAALRSALPVDWLVAAIEPGRDMRRVLSRRFSGDPGVQVIDAAAEAMPLPTQGAALVIACSAFHWFDRAAFMAEAARVLAPRGVLALVRNRMCPSPVIESFDSYVAAKSVGGGDRESLERRREPTVRDLKARPDLMAVRSFTVGWTEERDCRSLIDLYLTRSTVWEIVRRVGLGEVLEDLSHLCRQHGPSSAVIQWQTTVKLAQRRL
jgi:SAM-dependent methyltransferase